MVLLYQPLEKGPMLVLDNLTNVIHPLVQRTEIEPVYGFNQHYLWVVDKTAKRTKVGGSSRLARWQALLGRMQSQPLRQTDSLGG